eukprot:CAMPEP_0119312138 /NCGR_PEP_ID=MMETSP1333-20130426/25146_1 /TAXON_ID=418940 /ORGANISM="Scyphosphaera apsteinii, Strain RCC1455" /LENGTH=107 /DNA_ID=CAMNT_0007316703 /DNA_START=314 /DNA_END=637 /DNA_ORIENTATION=-
MWQRAWQKRRLNKATDVLVPDADFPQLAYEALDDGVILTDAEIVAPNVAVTGRAVAIHRAYLNAINQERARFAIMLCDDLMPCITQVSLSLTAKNWRAPAVVQHYAI